MYDDTLDQARRLLPGQGMPPSKAPQFAQQVQGGRGVSGSAPGGSYAQPPMAAPDMQTMMMLMRLLQGQGGNAMAGQPFMSPFGPMGMPGSAFGQLGGGYAAGGQAAASGAMGSGASMIPFLP